MLCKVCKNKPIVRGIKKVNCLKCGKETFISIVYGNICEECSDRLQICQCCGKELFKNDSDDIEFIIAEYKDLLENANMDMLNKKVMIREFIDTLEVIEKNNKLKPIDIIKASATYREEFWENDKPFIENRTKDELLKILGEEIAERLFDNQNKLIGFKFSKKGHSKPLLDEAGNKAENMYEIIYKTDVYKLKEE